MTICAIFSSIIVSLWQCLSRAKYNRDFGKLGQRRPLKSKLTHLLVTHLLVIHLLAKTREIPVEFESITSNTMTLGKLVIKCPGKPREALWKSRER